jgi:hypothetical protein
MPAHPPTCFFSDAQPEFKLKSPAEAMRTDERASEGRKPEMAVLTAERLTAYSPI